MLARDVRWVYVVMAVLLAYPGDWIGWAPREFKPWGPEPGHGHAWYIWTVAWCTTWVAVALKLIETNVKGTTDE